ncbi:MAG: hypothetical protein RIB03_15505 [Henriciella sp.]|uniref:hypothetical protein n=1 Tax=Henriciella sp. TaxID=1968823 RepID=UPI0032EDCBDF
MRRTIGCTLVAASMAAAQPAFAQFDSLPSGDLDLRMEGLNEKYAMYIEHGSLATEGSTVWFWALQVIPESIGSYAAWTVQGMNCATREAATSEIVGVKPDGSFHGSGGEAREMGPITPDSMEASLFQVVCEDKSFELGEPAVSTVAAAMDQGRATLKRRFGVE